MSPNQRRWTIDNNTNASNPGKVRISYLRYWKRFPILPTLYLLITVLSLGIASQYDVRWIFLGLSTLIMLIFNWYSTYEKFAHGDANPGLVVSINPLRVAVLTDLTMGRGHYPALKIIQEPDFKQPMQPKIGDGVATVSLYDTCGPANKVDQSGEHWGDFMPTILDPVARSNRELAMVKQSFSETMWEDLQNAVASVSSKKVGFYPIISDNSSWNI